MPEHRTDTAATPAPDDTLREQLLWLLIKHCTIPRYDEDGTANWDLAYCPTCGAEGLYGPNSPSHARHQADALLPLIRDHVAAAVQQRDAALELASKNGQAAAEAHAAAMDAEAAIERVRHLHRRLPWPECHLDGESWPCRTIRELDGMEATDG